MSHWTAARARASGAIVLATAVIASLTWFGPRESAKGPKPRCPPPSHPGAASAGSTDERALVLDDLAKYELAAGRLDAADAFATELLALAPELEGTWNHGNMIHAGHTIQGLVALRRDNLEDAKRHLLASAETPGSPQLNSFGPSMALAHALVERGEVSVVLQYLERCDRFWEHGHDLVTEWQRDLRSHRTANFNWYVCR